MGLLTIDIAGVQGLLWLSPCKAVTVDLPRGKFDNNKMKEAVSKPGSGTRPACRGRRPDLRGVPIRLSGLPEGSADSPGAEPLHLPEARAGTPGDTTRHSGRHCASTPGGAAFLSGRHTTPLRDRYGAASGRAETRTGY